jgi:CHRD domain
MTSWVTGIRKKCLRMQIRIFLSPGQVRSTAGNTASLLCGACFLSLLLGAATSTTFQFRLSPGPRLVGTRADRSGGGAVIATLEDNELTLKGSFSGLLAVPTGAHLLMGSLPGVRGPVIADLTVSPSTSGTLSGRARLNASQLAALHKGGLYVEIDSDKAPQGDLWGWILPQ